MESGAARREATVHQPDPLGSDGGLTIPEERIHIDPGELSGLMAVESAEPMRTSPTVADRIARGEAPQEPEQGPHPETARRVAGRFA
ncbi:hypothetical protein CYFUS_003995 [Cystobacter fuscus]|uniref:Uncharacterized protein n=1 Tax=Cystobacter fuscus TaxID=43 RepID=A0A250J4U2_9BACT|nr:hypothetical protein CYFUS_003995 [Cystobacter fuscus]